MSATTRTQGERVRTAARAVLPAVLAAWPDAVRSLGSQDIVAIVIDRDVTFITRRRAQQAPHAPSGLSVRPEAGTRLAWFVEGTTSALVRLMQEVA